MTAAPMATAAAAPAPAARLPLYVALTTLPSRIEHLRPMLDSLRTQTRRPDAIWLCLPRWSTREACAYPRPAWLNDHAPLLEVLECASDDGPGTKLTGCLDRIGSAPACLVIADDDMRYEPGFLARLHDAQCAELQASFSHWTFPCGPFTVGQGADGFSFYTPNLHGMRAFARRALAQPGLRLVDDLWISAYLQGQGVAVKSLRHLLPAGSKVYAAAHTVNQLQNLEGEQEREALMLAGTRYLLESGMMGRRRQAEALLRALARRLRAAVGGS